MRGRGDLPSPSAWLCGTSLPGPGGIQSPPELQQPHIGHTGKENKDCGVQALLPWPLLSKHTSAVGYSEQVLQAQPSTPLGHSPMAKQLPGTICGHTLLGSQRKRCWNWMFLKAYSKEGFASVKRCFKAEEAASAQANTETKTLLLPEWCQCREWPQPVPGVTWFRFYTVAGAPSQLLPPCCTLPLHNAVPHPWQVWQHLGTSSASLLLLLHSGRKPPSPKPGVPGGANPSVGSGAHSHVPGTQPLIPAAGTVPNSTPGSVAQGHPGVPRPELRGLSSQHRQLFTSVLTRWAEQLPGHPAPSSFLLHSVCTPYNFPSGNGRTVGKGRAQLSSLNLPSQGLRCYRAARNLHCSQVPLLQVCPTRDQTPLLCRAERGRCRNWENAQRTEPFPEPGSRGGPQKQEWKRKKCWVGGDRQTPCGNRLHPSQPQRPGCTVG